MTSPLPTATAVARRHLALILAILLAVSAISLLAATPARAAVQTTIDEITYSVDPGTAGAEATATNYLGPDGSDVVIPDTVTIGGVEYTVTAIGDFVFYANQLTSVTLPDAERCEVPITSNTGHERPGRGHDLAVLTFCERLCRRDVVELWVHPYEPRAHRLRCIDSLN